MEEENIASEFAAGVNGSETLLEEEDAPEYVNVNQILKIKVESAEFEEKEVTEEIHQCNICTNKYNKGEFLELHKTVHNICSTQCICPVCFVVLISKKEYIKHINQHIRVKIKEEKRFLICVYCTKNFTTKRRLNIHIRVHTNERPHKCDICGEGFKQLGTLKSHLITHTKEKRFVCEICRGSFTTSSSLKRHKKRLHDKGKTLNCKHCEARFFNMTDFRNHKKETHPNKIYNKSCPYCFVVLHSRYSFHKHKQFHREDKIMFNSTGYVCMLCGKRSIDWQKFLTHRRMHMKYSYQEIQEGKQNNSLRCKLCSKSFTKPSALFKHMDVHMEDKIKCNLCPNYFSYFRLKVHIRTMHQKLYCPICCMVIYGSANLFHHSQKYHPTVRKKHPCNICRKSYMSKAILKMHCKVMHRENTVKNFKCAICGRQFLSKLIMAYHLALAHNKSSHYKCRFCDVAFNTRREFLSHRSAHNSKKIKPHSRVPIIQHTRFQCKVCKKFFHCRDNYVIHITYKTCHSFVKRTGKKKCHVCQKELRTNCGLTRHMETHNSYDNACRSCDKTFRVMDSLRKHIRRHHPGEDIYWCGLCGDGFDRFFEMTRHRRQHIVNAKHLEENTASVNGFLEIKVEPETMIKDEPQSDF